VTSAVATNAANSSSFLIIVWLNNRIGYRIYQTNMKCFSHDLLTLQAPATLQTATQTIEKWHQTFA
jgi:hypothetical protein